MNKIPGSERAELIIDDIELRKAKMLFKALDHKLRLQILQFIHQKKQTPVTAIYEALDLEQSITSQHLGILRRSGLVITQRDSKLIYYSVNYKRIEKVQKITCDFLNEHR